MKIKKLTKLLMLVAVTLFVGCDIDELLPRDVEVDGGEGDIELSCSTASKVGESRAITPEELPTHLVPAIGDFSMTMVGNHTNRFEPKAEDLKEGETVENIGTAENPQWKVTCNYAWNKISEIVGYNANERKVRFNKLKTGRYDSQDGYLNSYKIEIKYGETVGEGANVKYAEGFDKPYFKGTSVDASGNEASFSIKPKHLSEVNVNAKLMNSCFVVNVTDWMLNYFRDITFDIYTNDNKFTFTQVVTNGVTTFNCVQSKKVVIVTETDGVQTEDIKYTKVAEKSGLVLEPAGTVTANDDSVTENNLLSVNVGDENTPEYKTQHIFINPSQPLKFAFTAKKAQTGTNVQSELVEINNNLAAQSRYKLTIDCETAGAGNVINVGFNETWVTVETKNVNLNPDNK